MKTKERILLGALDLFNEDAATEVTTNEIARHLKMSPGNLYFHYKNKEQIIRELFKRLADETNLIWKPQTKLAKKNEKIQLVDFIERNLELYWKFRFFHRELYTLRKKDPELANLWKLHLIKLVRLMIILYKHWVRTGVMIPIQTVTEMEFLAESLFVSSNSFMLFFESTEGVTHQKTIDKAQKLIMRMLMPYMTGETKDNFEKFIQ